MPNKKPLKERKNKRNKQKYPALDPKYALKTRQDLIDVDYVEKLNDDEKAWLNKFFAEYVSADFTCTMCGKGFNDCTSKYHKQKYLHKTIVLRKACYKMNNDRNKDLFTKSMAMGNLDYESDLIAKSQKKRVKIQKKKDEDV